MPAGRIEDELGQVAEGIWTTSSLLAMADGVGVELPISAEVRAAIDGKPPLECLHALMTRAPRPWE
jgi:glycerol-3-phosphate dehydrogenase